MLKNKKTLSLVASLVLIVASFALLYLTLRNPNSDRLTLSSRASIVTDVFSKPDYFMGGRIEADGTRDGVKFGSDTKVVYTYWNVTKSGDNLNETGGETTTNYDDSSLNFTRSFPRSLTDSDKTTITVKGAQPVTLGWGRSFSPTKFGKCFIPFSADPWIWIYPKGTLTAEQEKLLITLPKDFDVTKDPPQASKILFYTYETANKGYIPVTLLREASAVGMSIEELDLDVYAKNPLFPKSLAKLTVNNADCTGTVIITPTPPKPSETPTPSLSVTPPTTTLSPTPPGVCTYDADIVLVLDRSGSMNSTESDGRTKLAWAKDAAAQLIDKIAATPNVKATIGIVSFGGQGNDGTGSQGREYDSTLHIKPTADFAQAKTALANVKHIKSGTCIECGLRIANEQLVTLKTRNRVVILLSDGKANHNWDGSTSDSKAKAIAEANKGRTSGINYYVLGYGSDADQTTLKAIAGKVTNFIYKPNASEWTAGFLALLDKVCEEPTKTPTPSICVMPSKVRNVQIICPNCAQE